MEARPFVLVTVIFTTDCGCEAANTFTAYITFLSRRHICTTCNAVAWTALCFSARCCALTLVVFYGQELEARLRLDSSPARQEILQMCEGMKHITLPVSTNAEVTFWLALTSHVLVYKLLLEGGVCGTLKT